MICVLKRSGVLLKACHQVGALHAIRVAGPVVHLGVVISCPPCAMPVIKHRIEVGARA